MATRRPRPVTVRMVVVALVLGVVLAVVSVPVGAVVARLPGALGLGGAWGAWGARVRFADAAGGVLYQRRDGPMATVWAAQRRGPFDEQWRRSFESRGLAIVAGDPRPRYARLGLAWPGGEAAVYAVGWPLVAAYATTTRGDSPTIHGTPMWEPRVFGETWFVPYRPRWFGLGVNTVFYGALALAVLALGRWMRVRRRVERGRCGACGYELGEGVDTCPECGLAAVRASVERG